MFRRIKPSTSSAQAASTEQQIPRRAFLGNLSKMGIALSLGVTGALARPQSAKAQCTPYEYQYRTMKRACGTCGQLRYEASYQRRTVRVCDGVTQYGAWTQYNTGCFACPV